MNYKLKNWIFRLIHPSFWYEQKPTCEMWDKILNKLLDEHTLKVGYLTCELGNVTLWTGNYPYAFGYLFGYKFAGGDCSYLPYPLTRLRLKKLLDQRSNTMYTDFLLAIEKDNKNREKID